MARITFVFFLALSLLAPPAGAASPDWAAVQALPNGERVEVHLVGGKTVTGEVDQVTPEAVVIRSKGATTEVRRGEIQRLYTKKKASKSNVVLIGSAIGAGAGGAFAAALVEREGNYAAAAAGSVVGFALIGAGVGYAVGGRSKRVLVYESKP